MYSMPFGAKPRPAKATPRGIRMNFAKLSLKALVDCIPTSAQNDIHSRFPGSFSSVVLLTPVNYVDLIILLNRYLK